MFFETARKAGGFPHIEAAKPQEVEFVSEAPLCP
jgi:hypothetical protein